MPPGPMMKCRLVANSTATKTSMPRTSVYGAECVKSGRAAVISKTAAANELQARTGRAQGRLRLGNTAHGDVGTSKQALRTGDEHDSHNQELGDQSQL